MELALDGLDQTVAHFAPERSALRQEMMVEEMEVVLSSEQAYVDARDAGDVDSYQDPRPQPR